MATAGIAGRRRWGRVALLACAVVALWYLPFGTLISVAEIALLLMSGNGIGSDARA